MTDGTPDLARKLEIAETYLAAAKRRLESVYNDLYDAKQILDAAEADYFCARYDYATANETWDIPTFGKLG